MAWTLSDNLAIAGRRQSMAPASAWPVVVAAMAVLVAAFCTAPLRAQPAPLFTTEVMLADPAQAEAIERFWDQVGQPGTITGQGGLTLATRRFLQGDPVRERGAVVISSGRTETMLKYKELVHDLWRNGYTVYLLDHRGQGLSAREAAVADDPQKGHVGRFDDFVDDLRQFVRTQVAPAGHRNLFLLAHSMGGAIATLLLETPGPEQALFRAAALSSPMLAIKGIGGWPADTLSCPLAGLMSRLGASSSYVAMGGGYKPKPFDENRYTRSAVRYARLLEQMERAPAARLGSPTWGWTVSACDGARRARTQGQLVKTPLLLMVAGDDQIVHADGARAFCAALAAAAPAGGCDGRGGGPVVIDGARHEMFIETDDKRGRVLQLTLAFFERHRMP